MAVNYKIILCIFWVFLFACTENRPLFERVEMPFEKYNFVRDTYRTGDIGLLMGNGEMGGLALNNGLGFEKLWFTDVWKDNTARKPIPGPQLILTNTTKNSEIRDYKTTLNIKNGILLTRASYTDGKAYSSKIFFSKTNKHLLVIHLFNESDQKLEFDLELPDQGFSISEPITGAVSGRSVNTDLYSQIAWSFHSSLPLSKTKERVKVELEPTQEITIRYSLTTHFDGEDFVKQALNSVVNRLSLSEIEKDHTIAWDKHWRSIASIILPDGDNAKWFYRSLYTLYVTAGADHFLPGELQFSNPDPDWEMCPFTYGHAGWSVWALAMIGDEVAAKNMAKNHYKPEALKENLKRIFPQEGPVEMSYLGREKGTHIYFDKYNDNAIAFGHNIYANGLGKIPKKDYHWDMQRQLDAFAASFYHVLSEYYPDDNFTSEYTYPVMRGTAELWASLAKWDSTRNHYFLPPLLSVSEDIMEPSIFDAVLAARWNLKMAIEYATKIGVDELLVKKWKHVCNNLYIPENDNIYLEYLDDNQSRKGGGYFGIRAFMYLGFPVMECIPEVDMEKARRSLDLAWKRNNEGEGMITFIMNWFATTEAMLGNGDKAFELSNLSTTIKDSTDCALYEALGENEDGTSLGYNIYFQTGYSSFIVSQIAMLAQSYSGSIKLFPAVPSMWKDVSFYDLPVIEGYKASGIMKSGNIENLTFSKKNQIVQCQKGKVIFEIDEIKNLIDQKSN